MQILDTLNGTQGWTLFEGCWIASAIGATGDGIYIAPGVQSIVHVNGGTIFNHARDGIRSDSSAVTLRVKGPLIRSCAGIGVNQTVGNSNVFVDAPIASCGTDCSSYVSRVAAVNSNIMLGQPPGYADGMLQLWNGGYIRYDAANTRFLIYANNTQSAIIDDVNGGQVSAGRFAVGGNQYLGMSGANPIVNFDTSDYLLYDTTNNQFKFFIGGTCVASLDSSGNLRCLGTVTPSVVP